ncbi:hypothetical protein BLL52_1542 [Rhodoferax antarcticus ANT.BR]|uniref:Uncharacterized protein n=1 Tax=Rhodoferax antarcticus ANT.BR TaxID=1111071 RepID=A0A1Q8YGY9_9BURK|nr:hypothetical protein BLL52_4072 [Rhodoferax antarcticus ANT.BR]OLP07255.1 hypothetical protein BLL52_1542 [Rhodoferax antarcticus ANT.BR]
MVLPVAVATGIAIQALAAQCWRATGNNAPPSFGLWVPPSFVMPAQCRAAW